MKVKCILEHHDSYAMQGPPGTGKTSTIVALASAFLSLQPDASPAAPVKLPKGQQAPAQKHLGRILVCAQSNAAVDELTLRLSTGVLDKHTGDTRCWLPLAFLQSPQKGSLGCPLHTSGSKTCLVWSQMGPPQSVKP